jgi:glycosyltransferase involved in cell wall biosynthesis
LIILLLIPDLGIGGAQKQFIETAMHLQSQKSIKLYLVSINSMNEYLRKNNKDIDIIYLRSGSGSISLFRAFCKYLILLYRLRPSIVHAWLGRSHRFAFCGRLFFKSKLIFGFRNTAISDQLSSQRLKKYFNFYFVSKFYVDLYFSNSLIQIDHLREVFAISELRNVYIPNGYNITNKNLTTSFAGRKIDQLKVLLPSRICPQKNQLDLLKFLMSTPQIVEFCHFYLTGPIYDKGYYEGICNLIASNLLLSKSVTVKTNDIDILAEFQNSDVILLNSIYEGFSNVILEAWDNSKILVVSKTSDPNCVVLDGYNGFSFDTYNILSDILGRILHLAEEGRTDIVINGKATLTKYSFEKIAGEYLKHYKMFDC